MENKQLVHGLCQKDTKAVKELLNKYTPILYDYAFQFVSNKGEIPDLISDTFEACLTSIHRFEGRSSFKTWLIQIFRHKAYKLFKIQRQTIAVEEGFLESREEVPTWAQNPEEITTKKELLLFIDEAIGRLPSPYYEILYLKDVEGLRSKEICDIFGLSEVNFRVSLHRARSKVKSMLDKKLKKKV